MGGIRSQTVISNPRKHISVDPCLHYCDLITQFHERCLSLGDQFKQTVPANTTPFTHCIPTFSASQHSSRPDTVATIATITGFRQRCKRDLMQGHVCLPRGRVCAINMTQLVQKSIPQCPRMPSDYANADSLPRESGSEWF